MESIGDGEDFLTGERAKKIIKEKLADVTEQTVQDFKDLTDKWNHKVDINVRQDGDEIIVSTEDKAFLYLSNGTATHRVEPIEKQSISVVKPPAHYVDNKKFLAALIDYKNSCLVCLSWAKNLQN